jgi:hypothetical protein
MISSVHDNTVRIYCNPNLILLNDMMLRIFHGTILALITNVLSDYFLITITTI